MTEDLVGEEAGVSDVVIARKGGWFWMGNPMEGGEEVIANRFVNDQLEHE